MLLTGLHGLRRTLGPRARLGQSLTTSFPTKSYVAPCASGRTGSVLRGLVLRGLVLAIASFSLVPTALTMEIRKYESGRFVLHTDLDASQVQQQLQRMERVLELSERYWGKKLSGRIHCYLVHELRNWSPCDLPAEFAPRVLRQLGGGTDVQPAPSGSRMVAQAIIYATTLSGIVEHEVVHAYCFQAFGRGGPDWYREGMAELFAQQVIPDHQLPGRPETMERLRGAAPIELATVLHNPSYQQLRDSILSGTRPLQFAATDPLPAFMPRLKSSLDRSERIDQAPTNGKWSLDDEHRLEASKQAYAEGWALCYLLYHHPQYRERFQCLGKHMLSGAPVRFEQAFAAVLPEIQFELRQFAEHVQPGYRSELCRWQLRAAPRRLSPGESIGIRVHARRGFQPAEITVQRGDRYQCEAAGRWQTGSEDAETDADGAIDGRGQLVAAVIDDASLAATFPLGRDLTLETNDAGSLYLRCQDALHELEDNRGSILVRLTRLR